LGKLARTLGNCHAILPEGSRTALTQQFLGLLTDEKSSVRASATLLQALIAAVGQFASKKLALPLVVNGVVYPGGAQKEGAQKETDTQKENNTPPKKTVPSSSPSSPRIERISKVPSTREVWGPLMQIVKTSVRGVAYGTLPGIPEACLPPGTITSPPQEEIMTQDGAAQETQSGAGFFTQAHLPTQQFSGTQAAGETQQQFPDNEEEAEARRKKRAALLFALLQNHIFVLGELCLVLEPPVTAEAAGKKRTNYGSTAFKHIPEAVVSSMIASVLLSRLS